MRRPFYSARLSVAAAACLGLAACASTQPNPMLEQARSQVGTAAQDPVIARHAPLELQNARRSLQAAEAAWEADADPDVVNHRAYVAAQQAAIARETAQLRDAREQIKTAEADRTGVLLSAREREAQSAQEQAASAQARARQLQQELSQLQTRQTAAGVVVTLGNVLFQTDSAELVPGAAAQIDQLAQALRKYPDATVEVGGYTDSTGNPTYNLGLSQRRADTVRQALVRSGIAPNRIMSRGYGEAAPVASNDTQQGRQMNRRVEVVVSGPGFGGPQASGTVR